MNPEDRLEELNKTMAELQAEIASAKADVAVVKAKRVRNPQTDPSMDGGRNLQGNRGTDGSLLTEQEQQYAIEVDGELVDYDFTGDTVSDEAMTRLREEEGITKVPEGFHVMEDGTIMADDEMTDSATMSMAEAMESLVMRSKGNYDSFRDKGVIGAAADAAGMSRVDFVMSPEFQAVYGNKYDKDAQPLEVRIDGDESNLEGQALEDALDKKMQESYDMDINVRKDSESAKMKAGSTGMQDRATPMKDNTPSRSMGMTEDAGGTSSVDTKDDFWKTEEGYNKAMEMYGKKPAWVKEPTMMFNPETQKYEKIKEEDKEQYEDLGISADIKSMFG